MEEQFESYRNHLLAIAYRMLGSLTDAEDAVQETWLRLYRSDRNEIENLGGWLTTVTSRICLDMLRSRKARREESIDDHATENFANYEYRYNPEQEALLADSVGLALLVVLDKLNPAERMAFVLHDIFAVPFSEIAPVVGKSELATRKLASRARQKVRGQETNSQADLDRQRKLVDAFLDAAYAGNFDSLVAMLDPDVVLRDDRETGVRTETRGAISLAKKVSGHAKAAQVALVNGCIGAIAAPGGKLLYVIQFTIKEGKITEVDLISNSARLEQLNLTILSD
ncbi:RNA polymerase sigma factor SigJ [Niallia circulans]|uniref:sigma-70 family RNA polymerase sigma factor n=1 Tax=Shouchella clausii TaxID=79880 RepID=UPI000B96D1B5|nr:sigma-70 family RNA polymerase sigma factor [Shouchella clausii]PAD40669.1 RNA polymerase subunit sigma-70 [Bacillus sp. 7520-S]SPT81726.1 RNA polymerase sigma factor SigJ [Niallia circulans]AST94722.1 RNA polymerase subunit sigma-70 [Shouchella clausii]MBU8597109.1 sigma-70 family RNA polymerase sigma factor [Shouchella clausii]MCR1289931.1 sigma-70 family RNA polymerase sigma factor [Shouchella clausii]